MLIPAAILCAGEHQRRLAVELALLAGDSRLLLDDGLSSGQRAWIEGRVVSELNLLPLLARYAAREQGEALDALSREIDRLQQMRQQPSALQRAATALSERYPVNFPVDLQQPLQSDRQARTESLYNRLCLGCHATPAGEHSVIIGTLGSFSRSMSDREWLARMLGGLRGDPYTGLENPFSDSDIARLFRYTRDSLR
ncbi:MAG: hypothetical protein OQL28_10050 [Sedimenticola sp.]|nr:hypothetical protein [Sedimenticola sp.]